MMSLLAEEVVEEWLNLQGYFSIRGLRLGVHEIDLLAIRAANPGHLERRHIEVQISIRPVSFISRVPKEVQRSTGKAANSAKRSQDELTQGVKEWVVTKFLMPNKLALMQSLCPGTWTRELVLHNVKSDEEVELIRSHGIQIHWLVDIVGELKRKDGMVKSARGGDLLELIHLSAGVARA